MKILGLIPARAGSKGVPGKNKKVLAGKPLLVHTVEAALNAEKLTDVVFTSEDSELNDIAINAGAEVLFKRPESLAQDDSSSIDVVVHALNELKKIGREYDAVCLLQVTNPFREVGFIDKAIHKFMHKNIDTLISVLPIPHEFNPYWSFVEKENETLVVTTGDKEIIKRRQDLPTTYYRDGSLYLTKNEILLLKKSFFGNSVGYITSNPKFHVNIDTNTDWERAVELAEKFYKI